MFVLECQQFFNVCSVADVNSKEAFDIVPEGPDTLGGLDPFPDKKIRRELCKIQPFTQEQKSYWMVSVST